MRRRQPPAVAAQFGECRRRRTGDRGRRIVPRLVEPTARQPPSGVVVAMRTRVPALRGHVDPAAKGEAVVDRHDLLVMRRSGRVMGVELHMDARMPCPLPHGEQRLAAKDRLQRADVPAQQIQLQLRIALDQPVEEIADRLRPVDVHAIADQRDTRVEIPSDQHDALLRRGEGFARHAEIAVGVDDYRQAVRPLDPPDIAIRFEHLDLSPCFICHASHATYGHRGSTVPPSHRNGGRGQVFRKQLRSIWERYAPDPCLTGS